MHGEEEVELDFSGEVDDLINDIRLLMLFTVHTTKPFCHPALLKSMSIAWSPAQDVVFKFLRIKGARSAKLSMNKANKISIHHIVQGLQSEHYM